MAQGDADPVPALRSLCPVLLREGREGTGPRGSASADALELHPRPGNASRGVCAWRAGAAPEGLMPVGPFPPLCPCRKQEERVQQVRKKLEEALTADILSRAADTERDGDMDVDHGEEA